MAIELHEGDLPDGVRFGTAVAVDTETMGLNPQRDRLCLVQLSGGDGNSQIVRLKKGQYEARNLKALLADPAVTKIFHYARFDIAAIKRFLGVVPTRFRKLTDARTCGVPSCCSPPPSPPRCAASSLWRGRWC